MSPLTSEPQGLSTAVVLVVEDNPLILMTALDLVTTSGFQGIGAASADEAIAILEVRSDIRLVFTDVEMPGTIDGLKLATISETGGPGFIRSLCPAEPSWKRASFPSGRAFFPSPMITTRSSRR